MKKSEMILKIKLRVKEVLANPDKFPIRPKRKKWNFPKNFFNKRKKQSLPKKPPYINEAEREFINNFFSHSRWIPQPNRFRLNGYVYKPDFYDIQANAFIEVSATRQAYHANKIKYNLLRELYPNINFEIRKPTGELLNETGRIDWA